MKKLIIALLVFSSQALVAQQTYVLDEFGEKLKAFYLGLNVENHWLAGQHINWETGATDNTDDTKNIKTHSGSFVAAACKKLNIYLIRPPEHSAELLCNAQSDWLQTSAASAQAWRHIQGGDRYAGAQDLANKGFVVLAAVASTDPHKPGHIALVMPAVISTKDLTDQGPQVIMAGPKNYSTVSLKAGFKGFVNKWPETQVEFYYFMNPVF